MPAKVIELTIPIMGSVENARLVSWYMEEGASFSKGDALCELETDKTVSDLEAEDDGILVRRTAEEGDEFKVGDQIGWQAIAGTSQAEIEQELAEIESRSADQVELETEISIAVDQALRPATANAEPGGIPAKTSPRARKLAREHGIDIATVSGTGPKGRITGEDVEREAAQRTKQKSAQELQSPEPSHTVSQDALQNPQREQLVGGVSIPHSMRRKTIARNLSTVKQEAPHLTADMDIDLSSLLALRARQKASGQAPPSILSYFAVTTARLLVEHKHLNATFREEDMMLWDTVNLGLGVDTDEGLVVPVVRDAQALTASEMTVKIAGLADRARRGVLTADELSGGTFTVSNPGSIGPVVRAEAVLNRPQVAILGLPGIVRKPVAVEMPDGSYGIQVRPILRAGVTFDHRALDGGTVIRFLNGLKTTIETIGL